MYRLLLAVACSHALQPRPKTLEALKTSRRDLLPLAGLLFAPQAAFAATSEELKAMICVGITFRALHAIDAMLSPKLRLLDGAT